MIMWSMRSREKKRDWVRENAPNSHSARRNTRAALESKSHYGDLVIQMVKIRFFDLYREEETVNDFPYFII